MREWEIGAVQNIHGALPYIRFATILALVGVGVNRIGKVCSLPRGVHYGKRRAGARELRGALRLRVAEDAIIP